MKSETIDLQPAYRLLDKHTQHTAPYETEFRGINLLLHPEVFNPAYTKVSGFLLDNLEIEGGESCLEMFSGSGALALIVGRDASTVVGVDISPLAIKYARINAQRLCLGEKVFFRHGNLWDVIYPDEKFDVIFANPPLLPVEPESLLEMAIADSPKMRLTQTFISGLGKHLTSQGRAYTAFSDSCRVYVGNPVEFANTLATAAGLNMDVKAEWDVGYEIYRILRFHPRRPIFC